MVQKLFRIILPFIIFFTSVCQGYAADNVSGTSNDAQLQGIQLLNSNNELITGVIAPGSDVTAKTVIYNGGTEPISYSMYVGVYSDNSLLSVGKSESQTVASGAEKTASAICTVPETVGQNYYIAIFHLIDESFSPLCEAITFAASDAYATESVTYNSSEYVLGREVVADWSFENDNLVTNGWNSRLASDIIRSADNKNTGNYSCKVYSRENYYDSITQDITDRLREEGSGVYRVTYSVLPVASASFKLSLTMTDKGGTETHFTPKVWNDMYITAAEANKWTTNTKFPTIEVPDALHNAKLYCETTSGTTSGDKTLTPTTDFYIDDCSLRKLISYTEYVKQNACTEQIDLDLELSKIVEEYAEVYGPYKVVHPKDSDKVIKNPYKGLNYYTTTMDFSKLDLTQPGAQISNVVYARYGWDDIEPEDGVYRFDQIDKNIELLKKYNMKLGIGIGATVCYNSSTSYDQQTPEWLFEKYNAQHYDLKIGNNTVKMPIYNDPIFMDKMQRFLTAFAEHYKYNTDIAFVDMRNYGNWGEWHFTSSVFNEYREKYPYTSKDLTNLVDMFKDFKLPLLMFTSNTASLNYAVDNYSHIGVRVDGVLNPNVFDNHLKMKFIDGRNFSVAEWYVQPESYYEGGSLEKYYGYLPTYIEKVVREGGASYISLGYWNPETFYSKFTDLSNRLANRTGYWFKPIKITYPESLTRGIFTMTLKNDGSTQLYAGYKRNPAIKLALADKDGNIIDTVKLEYNNPEDWKAGQISYVGGEYAFTNTSGAAKLYLGIFSDADNSTPDIKLGTYDEPTADGWYDITNMTESENVSDSRLYTTSLPYAEDGYGYRDPYYAFDNNSDTYFASEVREGEYMEISFGEYVDISKVTFNSKGAIYTPVTILGYNGKEWVELHSKNMIYSGNNSCSFKSANISKLRLKFNKTKLNYVLKITEMSAN